MESDLKKSTAKFPSETAENVTLYILEKQDVFSLNDYSRHWSLPD
jgi:hypothetical protein